MKIRMSDKPLNWTEEDRRGQIRAMEVVKEALEDEEWRQVVRTKTVQVEVTGLDDKGLVEAFDGFLPPPSGSNSTTTSTRDKPLLPLGSLVTMRRLLNDLRLESNVSPWRDEEELKEELLTGEVRRRRALVEELSEEEKAAMKSSRKRKKSGEGGSTATSSLRDWPEGSCFPKVSIGNSTSAKINWVVAEVRLSTTRSFRKLIALTSSVFVVVRNADPTSPQRQIHRLLFLSSRSTLFPTFRNDGSSRNRSCHSR